MNHFLKLLYRRPARKASYEILMGRMIERGRPEKGRFLRGDVDAILKETWRNVDAMLPAAELEKLPTRGNRHNVFLAVLTVAGYHAYLSAGIERDYAIELFADVGWKLYAKAAVVPRLAARLLARDPQRQLEIMLRILMVFPFSAPGRPGYEVKAWAERDRFCTYWTHCPPHSFVRRWVERNGDRGELEAFRRSWCWYDWAITHVMVGGDRREGRYERPHTLSSGDGVCDMCWYARPQREGGAGSTRGRQETLERSAPPEQLDGDLDHDGFHDDDLDHDGHHDDGHHDHHHGNDHGKRYQTVRRRRWAGGRPESRSCGRWLLTRGCDILHRR